MHELPQSVYSSFRLQAGRCVVCAGVEMDVGLCAIVKGQRVIIRQLVRTPEFTAYHIHKSLTRTVR